MRPARIFAVAVLASTPVGGQLSSYRAAIHVEDDVVFYEPAGDDEFAYAVAAGDFDGDGADDLATGIPFDDNLVGMYPDSGIVVVRYGVPGRGLDDQPAQAVLTQVAGGSPDPDGAEPGDSFGAALAVGDFDGDGFDDLAVGVPGEGVAGYDGAGAVQIHPGSAAGLDLVGSSFFHENTSGVPGEPDDFDGFATALAVGDFDGDGFDDLAVGTPYAGSGVLSPDGYGEIDVFYGSAGGLSTAGVQRFTQETPGIPGSNEDLDNFGRALAACDFDADGYADLGIGVPGENDGAGNVRVLYGSATGLDVVGVQSWDQGAGGLPETAENGDLLGFALACGDFDGDARADLAAGAFGEDLGGAAVDAGSALVLYGGVSGLSATGAQLLSQDLPLIPDAADPDDHFGIALAAGDFAHDGADDLVVGVRGENNGHGPYEGMVVVAQGTPQFGLLAAPAQAWWQGFAAVPGTGEQGDEFGWALATGDFDGTGHADLVVGAPRETLADVPGFGHGAEWALYGYLFGDGFELGTSAWSVTVP